VGEINQKEAKSEQNKKEWERKVQNKYVAESNIPRVPIRDMQNHGCVWVWVPDDGQADGTAE
jgi:hypothetical protein